MNLAILIGHFPPGVVGGAELQAETWAKRLARRHRVTVLTRHDPPSQAAREERDGFEVVRMPVASTPIWRTWRDVVMLERAVRDMTPRPDLTLAFQTFISGLAGVRIQGRLGIPAVVWLRGEDEVRMGVRDRSRWIGPQVWRHAAGVLVQSEAIRVRLIEALRGVDSRTAAAVATKLEVVPNGIELPEPPFSPGAGVFAVGRLIPDKGMDTAIEAAARAGLALTIAGDGPDRSRLEGFARVRGADVTFLGMVDPDRLGDLYRTAGCVVLAARGGEGLPNVLLEAMAHARPVVATPVMGVADLVQDGANGLLVSPGDPAALAAALSRLADDPALAVRLGAAARTTAEGFAWDRIQPRLETVLERWRRT